MYQPFPSDKFNSLERYLWFQELVEHIAPQVESEPCDVDLARVAELPQEARVLYSLWMFYASVGGNGIEVFLLQSYAQYTPQAHEALQLVGAFELVERLEAGIPHAIDSGCAEFTERSDFDWFKQFKPSPKFPTLESVDVGVYDLVGDDLCDKVNAYIEEHRDVLIA